MTTVLDAGDAGDAGLRRAVAGSVSSQMAARAVHLALNLASTLALIHYLGPDGYGEVVVVLTVVGLFGLAGEFGLPKLGVREVARQPERAGAVIGTVVGLRLLLSIAAAAGAQLAMVVLDTRAAMRLAVLVLCLTYVCESLLSVAIAFHVALRQEYEAVVRVAMEATELAVLLVLISRRASLVMLMAAPVVGAVTGAVLALLWSRRRFGLHLSFVPRTARALLGEAIYVGPAALLGVAYLKVDHLVLAGLRPAREVGIYGAAYQPIEYLLVALAILNNVLFPLLARWHATDPGRFVPLYRRATDAFVAVTLPVPVLAAFVAPDVIAVALAPRFAPSAGVLRLLGVALVFMMLHTWQGTVLIAAGQQRIMLRCLAAALVVNVALDVVLVSWFGYTGAGLATLATSALVCWWTTRATRLAAGAALDYGSLARVVAAAAVMAVTCAATLAVGLPWWLAAGVALAAYGLALLRLGAIDPGVLHSVTASATTEEVLEP
jgi:O-antigen/teichoic acid export membrane protein